MGTGVWLLPVAGLLGAAGVLLGAFGAHGLKSQLGPTGLDTWHTAVTYHLLHAVALLGVGVWWRVARAAGTTGAALPLAGGAFAIGVLLFSGSLYILALGGPRWLGPVTPVGGAAFIAGWAAVIWAALRTTP